MENRTADTDMENETILNILDMENDEDMRFAGDTRMRNKRFRSLLTMETLEKFQESSDNGNTGKIPDLETQEWKL